MMLGIREKSHAANALIARLAAAGVPATIAELVTTPLDQQTPPANGSGVSSFVRRGCAGDDPAAAPVVGAACATQRGWSFRMQTWPES